MKIENEKIILSGLEIKKYAHLPQIQLEIIGLFQNSYSINEVAQYFFKKGFLVSFLAVLRVIEILMNDKLITNPVFYRYFGKQLTEQKGFFDKLADKLLSPENPRPADKEKIAKVSFFRSLSPELLKIFLKNSNLVEIPAGVTLCQEGGLQRSLLVLLTGQATVYKKELNGSQSKVVVLTESSVFGEAGFFLGEKRTASVKTDLPSQVLVIKHIPEIYDDMIKADKARHLQTRIWTIHALLKSQMFRDLPQDCFDALIFSGEFKTVPDNTVICRQGDSGRSCYIIIQGEVKVVKNQNFIRKLTQGDSFGEIALVATAGLRTANVQAVTEVLVLEIEMAQFYRLLSENLLLGCEFEKLAFSRIKQANT